LLLDGIVDKVDVFVVDVKKTTSLSSGEQPSNRSTSLKKKKQSKKMHGSDST
jgi:hypothetical protein